MKHYLDAIAGIPSGETRSYMELAVLAGKPGAARAAGRAVSSCETGSRLPWHRVVRADGRPKASDREPLQWRRLRREGARPRAKETITDWARRVGAALVGNYPTREFATRRELASVRWSVERVEPLEDEASALSRGFRPLGAETAGKTPLPSKSTAPHSRPTGPTITERLEELDWRASMKRLQSEGALRLTALLSREECASILSASSDASRYERSTDMAPKGYGVGAYHYYREPLPEPLPGLRDFLYRALAPEGFPVTLEQFWERCRDAGQRRGSSILIGYPRGGINHLHRDVYGPVWFPYQALVMLSKRGRDFEGGEFVLEEDGRSREYPVTEGDVLIFKSRPHRHGMRVVRRGTRYGVGLVFHLAE